MQGPIEVRGLHELQAAYAQFERDTRLEFRAGLRHVAEPVQRGAEQLAATKIRNMPRSPRWSKMRIGITRDLVYVAPRQRGARAAGDPRRRGQQFANLLMDRAMEPALQQHTGEIEASLQELLDRAADKFNHGGAV